MKLSALRFAILLPVIAFSFFTFIPPSAYVTSVAVAAPADSPGFSQNSKLPINGSSDFAHQANKSNNPRTFIATTATNILSIALLLVGIISVFFLILYGFQYLTAGGDPDKAKKARAGIINAVIGIAIIAAAFSFVKIGIQGGSLFQGFVNTDNTAPAENDPGYIPPPVQ